MSLRNSKRAAKYQGSRPALVRERWRKRCRERCRELRRERRGERCRESGVERAVYCSRKSGVDAAWPKSVEKRAVERVHPGEAEERAWSKS